MDIKQVDGYLVDTILEYESDTFSASGSEITEEEAKVVADKIVKWLVDNRLDGVMIDGMLAEIREEDMNIEEVRNATTAEEARQYAIDWQNWQAEQSLSYSELAEWQGVFNTLAEKFDLSEEFKENGVV